MVGNEQIKSLIDDVAKYWEYANEEDLEGITVSKKGGFTIGNFTVSSGQGGVVAIWDDQGEMVHISKAAYGLVSAIFDGYVYTLCGVMYWGHPLSYAMAKSPFGVMDAWKEADEFEDINLDDEGVSGASYNGEEVKLEVNADKFVISYGDKVIEVNRSCKGR